MAYQNTILDSFSPFPSKTVFLPLGDLKIPIKLMGYGPREIKHKQEKLRNFFRAVERATEKDNGSALQRVIESAGTCVDSKVLGFVLFYATWNLTVSCVRTLLKNDAFTEMRSEYRTNSLLVDSTTLGSAMMSLQFSSSDDKAKWTEIAMLLIHSGANLDANLTCNNGGAMVKSTIREYFKNSDLIGRIYSETEQEVLNGVLLPPCQLQANPNMLRL